jgi:hypothetical protein
MGNEVVERRRSIAEVRDPISATCHSEPSEESRPILSCSFRIQSVDDGTRVKLETNRKFWRGE